MHPTELLKAHLLHNQQARQPSSLQQQVPPTTTTMTMPKASPKKAIRMCFGDKPEEFVDKVMVEPEPQPVSVSQGKKEVERERERKSRERERERARMERGFREMKIQGKC